MTAIQIFNTSHHTLPPATLPSPIESSFLWAHHPQFEWELDFGALTVMDSNPWKTSNPVFFFFFIVIQNWYLQPMCVQAVERILRQIRQCRELLNFC